MTSLPSTEEIRLRDGRLVRTRWARTSDVELFLRFFEGLSAQSRDFMHGWSRSTRCTREHADQLAARAAADDHCCLVVLDGVPPGERIVGYSWIQGIGGGDIPMLGIGVVDDYHDVGLGTALMRRMIDAASQRSVDRVKLGVFADNERAIHVYEAVGFRVDPTIPARDFDGRTELYMVVDTGH